MSDIARGPRPIAAGIAARLALVGAPLSAAQYARLVRVVATKEQWDVTPMTAAARKRVRDGIEQRHAVQAAD